VGVRIDEPWARDETGSIQRLECLLLNPADGDDPSIPDPDLTDHSWCSGAVGNSRPSNTEIKHVVRLRSAALLPAALQHTSRNRPATTGHPRPTGAAHPFTDIKHLHCGAANEGRITPWL
jgi:hypothetical protein